MIDDEITENLCSENFSNEQIQTIYALRDIGKSDDFEKNYFKEGSERFKWGQTVLNRTDYNKKALEIVLPDVIISENALKVLNDFKTEMEAAGLEVWYVVTK